MAQEEKTVRDKVKELVDYAMDTDEDEVIEVYTDSFMIACEEYHEEQSVGLLKRFIEFMDEKYSISHDKTKEEFIKEFLKTEQEDEK